MNIKVVAISGWKRSGKDTAANILIRDYKAKKISFADPLKELVAHQYNIPIQTLYDQDLKEAPLLQYPVTPKDTFSEAIYKLLKNELQSGYWTPRALAILEGSIKRSVNCNYWIEQAINKIMKDTSAANEFDNTKPQKLLYVIPDLRYKNEVNKLKEKFNGNGNLLLIRINRFDTIDTTDSSERDLDDYKFDVTVENKSTLKEFERNFKKVIEDFIV